MLAIFVAGKLINTMNATGWHWQKRRRWAAGWRERTSAALLESRSVKSGLVDTIAPARAKHVHFELHVARLWDDDMLGPGVKPVRDALAPWIIHDDGPTSGHRFTYSQVKDGRRGVTVRVRMRSEPEAT